MANYPQNGHPYYGQQNHPSASQYNQYGSYGSQLPVQNQQIRRTPSYDAGDDRVLAQDAQGYNAAAAAYQHQESIDNHQQSDTGPNHVLPLRTASYGSTFSSHTQTPQTAISTSTPPTYNPQQFSQPQSQYPSAPYTQTPTASSYPSYQPYNPAAYQPANVNRQSAYTTQTFNSSPSAYSAQSSLVNPQAPPPPPPRPYETSYAGRRLSHTTNYSPDLSTSNPAAIPQHRVNASSQPHSPPPPPVPPRHDSYSLTANNSQSYGSRPGSHDAHFSGSYNSGYAQSPDEGTNTYASADVRPLGTRMSSRASQHGQQHSSPYGTTQSTPSRQGSQAVPQRTDSLSHPHNRPLPSLPTDSESDSDYFGLRNGAAGQREFGYEDLMREVEAAVNPQGPLSLGPQRTSPRVDRISRQTTIREEPNDPTNNAPLHSALVPDERPSHTNGGLGAMGSASYVNYAAFSEDSDAEAAAGLALLQAAEEEEAAKEEARRRSGSASMFGSQSSRGHMRPPTQRAQEASSDSDYGNVDMSLMGGGYEAHMHYGDEPQSAYAAAANAAPPGYGEGQNQGLGSFRSSDRSSGRRSSQQSAYDPIPMPSQDAIHPFPPFKQQDVARVDTSGTGGFTEPSPHPRRMSFEDGDEATLVDTEGGQSPSRESIPDLFYHPGMSPQRPLPPPPIDTMNRIPHLIPAGTYGYQQYDASGRYGPDQYEQMLSPAAVPRSTSDVSTTRRKPQTEQPIRSKTDADRARMLKQQSLSGSGSYDSSGTQSAVPLDLPAIPKKRFNPAKITVEQFRRCTEPWALGSILTWVQELAQDESDLREHAIVGAIVALFVHKVPTMNTADAETLGAKVVKDMFQAGALINDEEWVKFGSESLSGVLFQLTGHGCYSPKLHNIDASGRCYSYHCMRTLKKIDLSQELEPEKKQEDWATYYGLTKEDMETRDKKEVERQNILHEIVTGEVTYMSNLDVLRILYRDSLTRTQPPIIPAKRSESFMHEVFGLVDDVKKVNEDYLLAQLKYRQREQGPWITGFSDIFREWIRKAKPIYVEYAAQYPRADYLIRHEAERNMLFQQFLNQAREDKRSNRLGWDNFLKAPIQRLQRYGLLLQTVQKQMIKESEEKTNLQFALDEVKAATFECNSRVAEMNKKMALLELQQKLQLRKGKNVELNLDHLGRQILIRGDLLRAGGKGLQWVETHAILLDNYLVLAKVVSSRDSAGGLKQERYDVSRAPIPMDLIVIESTNDDPVVKSSPLKGIGAVTSTARGQVSTDPRLARTTSTPTSVSGPGTLTHSNTNTTSSVLSERSSGKSMVTTTVLDGKDEKIMYPFKVKHLGEDVTYTLYAPSASNRQEWCEALVSAKTEHASALYDQNAEPFKLRVLADASFGNDAFSGSQRSIVIKRTPLDRAIREVEKRFKDQPKPQMVCRAAVNCATVFNQPYGRLMCAIGTDYGVFVSEYDNPRGWIRTIQSTKVTQVAVFEEFNLFILISDKSLIAYHLDVICPIPGSHAESNAARRSPQKLSGSREVGFFATGRMKDRALVIYKKKDGISSTFKVLEPVLQKSTTSRSRFLPSSTRRGATDFFREYDEFYIPTECYSINLFHSSLAVSTSHGVEVLTLDKKQPWTVPNLRSEQPEHQAQLSSMASHIKDLKPLGMFRLSESEFLVCFEKCGVYVNKHGDVSRSVVMEFVGQAKTGCLYGQYLILFHEDFIEIRNAANGRLKQVIAGKDIKMLDDGGGGNTYGGPASLGGGINGLGMRGYGAAPRTVKVCMQHPEIDRCQIVVELVENEALKDS